MQKTKTNTQKLALTALFTAIVAVLSYLGGFIKIGGLASISLTLIPVVLGAALLGPLTAAWIGAVSGIVFFFTPDAALWFGLSIPGTIITVLIKGALAGLAAGLVYKLLAKANTYLAIIISAIVAPVVNTSVFLVGSLLFFFDTVSAGAGAEGIGIFAYLIIFFVGLNFVFELLVNIVLSPALYRIMKIKLK